MSLKAGDGFFARAPDPKGIEHLFFVISNPDLDRRKVLIAPLMTWVEGKEDVCILTRGDHRFIKHPSYINFGCAAMGDADYIERNIRTKVFRKHDAVSADVLKKIREGAGRSRKLALELRDVLEFQKLVDPL